MPDSISLGEWKQFKAELDKLLKEDRQPLLQEAGEAVGIKFDEIARNEYPPEQRPQSQSEYWTDKQRRWWWATMHEKAQGKSNALPGWKAVYRKVNGVKTLEISGAYRRTGKGVQSLGYEVESTQHTVAVFYGTNRAYMRYVIDEEEQAEYHEGNWATLQELARDNAELLKKTFADAMFEGVKERLEKK